MQALNFVITLIGTMIEWIGDMAQVTTTLLTGDFAGAWEMAKNAVGNAISNMFPFFKDLWGWIQDTLARLGSMEARVRSATNQSGKGAANGEMIGNSLDLMTNAVNLVKWRSRKSPGKPSGKPAATKKPSGGGGRGRRSAGPTGPSAAELAERREELALQQAIDVARQRGDQNELRALERKRDLKQKIAAYERAGLDNAAAKLAAEKDLNQIDAARAEMQAKSLDKLERSYQLQIAELRKDYEMIDAIEEELFLEERISELREHGVSQIQAELSAQNDLLDVEEARAELATQRAEDDARSHRIELARLRGDQDAADRMSEDQRIIDRQRDLRGSMSDADAQAVAMQEAADRSRAHLQGTFRDTFRNGLQAALDGDLKGFFTGWLENASFDALSKVLDKLADNLANLIFDNQGSGSGGGLLSGLGSIFGGLFGSNGAGSGGAGISGSGQGTSLPGFASGGSFKIKGFAGIDRNILSLNGSPVARVGQGEIMNIKRGEQGGATHRVILEDTTGLFKTRVESIAGGQLMGASPSLMEGGAQVAMQKSRRRASRRIPTR